MKNISNPIIPITQQFYDLRTNKIVNWETNSNNNLDFQAITSFCSLGFMLDDDTFYNEIRVCKPATEYRLNEKSEITEQKTNWKWHYEPEDRAFNDILEEFTEIFENIVIDRTRGKKILLPISGGLDSRTLVVPVSHRKDVTLASYEFEDGFYESETGHNLSQRFNIPLFIQKIQRGYLWNKLDEFYELNSCFTDFTHPRQANAINNWKGLGDVILLGHWGDVLFDRQADSKKISFDEQLLQLRQKIIRPGSMELAKELWNHWGLKGSFESYITDRLNKLYCNINIDHPSARMRAFKSLYWAPRWTSINLSIFKRAGEIILPYYSDEMCQFICTVPERYLEGRTIQIEYIKKNCPEAAQISWQKFYPLNLYNYQQFNHPHYYIIRAVRKAKRILQQYFSKSPDLITRNWELQFLGEQNFTELKKNLLKNNKFNKLIPQTIIRKYLDKFQANPVKYATPISMLLALAVFSDRHYQE